MATKQTQYILLHDEKVKFRGTENECFALLLKSQPQSIHYAKTWGGWKIQKLNDTADKPEKIDTYRTPDTNTNGYGIYDEYDSFCEGWD